MANKKIFISCSSKNPDNTIASDFTIFFKKAGIQTFLATQNIRIGENWSRKIKEEIETCDYFMVLLSENSLLSDMVTEEIRKAKELRDSNEQKKPVLLPVRLNIPANVELNYDVAGYLNRIQQRLWKKNDDTAKIAKEIVEIINNGKVNEVTEDKQCDINSIKEADDLPVPSAPLEIPGGNIGLDSPYYIIRKGEINFMHKILQEGSLLRIKGPRQFGKTSLLSRIIQFAKQNDHLIVPFNFQQLNISNLKDLDKLLIQICSHITRKLGLNNKIKEFWEDELLDVKMKCTFYLEEYILQNINQPLVLAIDEADRVFEFKEVSSEFFGLLRRWHEEAKLTPIWKKLKIAIAHSTEAYLAISDLNQSPFNVGIDFLLQEFNSDEVSQLAEKHDLSLSADQKDELMELVGGHPFLIRKALYEIAKENYTFSEFVNKACDEEGPYIDHLRRYLLSISSDQRYIDVLKDVVNQQHSRNDLICTKLRAVGLIKGSIPNVKTSFKLYQDYFQSRLF